MTHRHKQTHNPRSQRGGHLSLRRLLLLPLAAGALATAGASCSQSAPSPVPHPIVTDTTPVGNGLKVIGYALLGGAVVMVLGSMVKS